MMYLFFIALTIIGATLHILIAKTSVIYTFLLYIFAINVGGNGIMAFLGHTVKAASIRVYSLAKTVVLC